MTLELFPAFNGPLFKLVLAADDMEMPTTRIVTDPNG
jgi:hypothetical protein